MSNSEFRNQRSEALEQRTENRGRRTEEYRRACVMAWVVILLSSVIGLPPSVSAAEADDGIDGVRAALEKYVETRKVISAEQRDWKLGREMLNERIDLVQQEIDSLREKIGNTEESIGEADKKRAELVEENERLKSASEALDGNVLSLEDNTRRLLKRLPDPIRERVRPLSQRLPEDPAETKLSLAERFQNVIGILNEVNKFNREITMTSEVRTLPDGTSAEVTALYAGIGAAWYATADGKSAGVGGPSDDGWAWTPANEDADEIAHAIAILKNEQVAAFVRLPVEIH